MRRESQEPSPDPGDGAAGPRRTVLYGGTEQNLVSHGTGFNPGTRYVKAQDDTAGTNGVRLTGPHVLWSPAGCSRSFA